MNYLIIEGADDIDKKYIIHRVAKELLINSDFVLKDGFLNESYEVSFCCVFHNKTTDKEILINTYSYLENHFKEFQKFKSESITKNMILTLFDSENGDYILKDILDETADDYILKIVLDEESDLDGAKDEIIKLLGIYPYNIYASGSDV